MSEFHVRVIRVDEIVPHPSADRMEIVMVDGGYPVCVKKDEYKPGDLAVYLPVDSIVPEDVEYFRFLAPPESILQDGSIPEKYRRIKAKKLRGVFSMGMLVPMRLLPKPTSKYRVGQNVQAELGIEKHDTDAAIEGVIRNKDGLTAKRRAYARLPWYRKPLNKIFWGRLKWQLKKRLGLAPASFSAAIEGPACFPEYTDIESLRKHNGWLQEGEEVVVTEKVHGANFRCGWVDGKFWVGSHHQFKAPPADGQATDVFWKAALQYDLKRLTSGIGDVAFFGEVYGSVQKGFGYDAPGDLAVRFFGAMDLKTHRWLDYDEFDGLCRRLGLATVPVLYRGPWSQDLRALAEGKSTLAHHTREGFVVTPVEERKQPHGARVILKLVGEGYLLKAA